MKWKLVQFRYPKIVIFSIFPFHECHFMSIFAYIICASGGFPQHEFTITTELHSLKMWPTYVLLFCDANEGFHGCKQSHVQMQYYRAYSPSRTPKLAGPVLMCSSILIPSSILALEEWFLDEKSFSVDLKLVAMSIWPRPGYKLRYSSPGLIRRG